MKTLQRCQWCSSSVYIVKCEHILLLTIDFEKTKVCWLLIEKINTFEEMIWYIMCYVVVI